MPKRFLRGQQTGRKHGGGEFARHNPGSRELNRRRASGIFHKSKEKDYEKDAGGLFYELAEGRKFRVLQPEAVSTDTAVDCGARQCIGDDNQHFRTSGVS